MKKLISVIIILTLLLGIFCSCGNSTSNDEMILKYCDQAESLISEGSIEEASKVINEGENKYGKSALFDAVKNKLSKNDTKTTAGSANKVEVPELYGMTKEEAINALSFLKLGYNFIDFYYFENNVCVVKTDPQAGEEVEPGTIIDVYINSDYGNNTTQADNSSGFNTGEKRTASNKNLNFEIPYPAAEFVEVWYSENPYTDGEYIYVPLVVYDDQNWTYETVCEAQFNERTVAGQAIIGEPEIVEFNYKNTPVLVKIPVFELSTPYQSYFIVYIHPVGFQGSREYELPIECSIVW